jgi:peptide/nickel transport system substrate-binding protein
MQVGTHAILGEYKNPAAVRKNISGVLKTAGSAYWNIQKN